MICLYLSPTTTLRARILFLRNSETKYPSTGIEAWLLRTSGPNLVGLRRRTDIGRRVMMLCLFSRFTHKAKPGPTASPSFAVVCDRFVLYGSRTHTPQHPQPQQQQQSSNPPQPTHDGACFGRGRHAHAKKKAVVLGRGPASPVFVCDDNSFARCD